MAIRIKSAYGQLPTSDKINYEVLSQFAAAEALRETGIRMLTI